MDILSYTGNVKTVTTAELFTLLAEIRVNVGGVMANIENIKANNLAGDFNQYSSQWVLTKSIEKAVADKGFRGSSLLDNIAYGMAAIDTGLEGLNKLIKGQNEKVWDGKLLNLRQANILNFIEYIQFWTKYSGMLIDVVLSMVMDKKSDGNHYLNGHDTKWLMGTAEFYKHFTVELLKGSRSLITRLEKIPSIELSSTALDVLEGSSGGKDATDLIGRGFGIHNLNPVFWFGLAKKELNLKRIDTMRAANQKHAMKISQAVNRRDGTNDPQIDREIDIYQRKIELNENTIEEIIKGYD
jgi:hypothetical protein